MSRRAADSGIAKRFKEMDREHIADKERAAETQRKIEDGKLSDLHAAVGEAAPPRDKYLGASPQSLMKIPRGSGGGGGGGGGGARSRKSKKLLKRLLEPCGNCAKRRTADQRVCSGCGAFFDLVEEQPREVLITTELAEFLGRSPKVKLPDLLEVLLMDEKLLAGWRTPIKGWKKFADGYARDPSARRERKRPLRFGEPGVYKRFYLRESMVETLATAGVDMSANRKKSEADLADAVLLAFEIVIWWAQMIWQIPARATGLTKAHLVAIKRLLQDSRLKKIESLSLEEQEKIAAEYAAILKAAR
jgi:hypothetical protein